MPEIDENTRIRDEILLAILPNVAFDGWTPSVVARGTQDAGYPEDMAFRAFPGGVPDVIRHWSAYADRRLLEEMAGLDVGAMRMRERIETAIRLRISQYAPHKESARRTIAHLALPNNSGLAARNLARSVDAIWRAAGDRSTDFSYYTKRASLLPIYVATILYWLEDSSEDGAETWAFLGRRIDDLMRMQKFRVPNPLDALRAPADLARRTAERVGRGQRGRRFAGPPARGLRAR